MTSVGGIGDLQLDGSWPGLRAPEDGIRIDPDELNAIADEFEREAQTLRSAVPGSVTNLMSNGTLMPGSFGSWGTGIEMETGYVEAHAWVTHYYDQMIDALLGAAQVLRASAGGHEMGDQLGGSGLNSQQAAMDHSGQPGNIPVA